MDLKKARGVVDQYRSLLSCTPKGAGPFDRPPTPREAMVHLAGMLDTMDKFLDEAGRVSSTLSGTDAGTGPDWDKFNRWLGFMQGVLWKEGTYTLNQMRDQNRP